MPVDFYAIAVRKVVFVSCDVFQSLWIGNRLSSMELLSIESFLHFGYQYHLYCYQPIENVPQGVQVRDANEILPESEIFLHRGIFGAGSPALFSDIWRYKLLHERGGWWVDTDVVCVRPFEFASEHIVGQQREGDRFGLNNAVIRTRLAVGWRFTATKKVAGLGSTTRPGVRRGRS